MLRRHKSLSSPNQPPDEVLLAPRKSSSSTTSWRLTPRRHSIASQPLEVANNNSHRRRKSLTESFQSITKSMSSSFRSIMRESSVNNLELEGGKLQLSKRFVRRVLANHFNQPELKVSNC